MSADAPIAVSAALPKCDYIYFATPSRASFTITREFVKATKAIVAQIHNTAGLRMPLVRRLRSGDKILLAFGVDGNYSPMFRCTICTSPNPVRTRDRIFDVCCYLDESLAEKLRHADYRPDPVVKRYTGISVSNFEDLRDIRTTIRKPKGNNTLRRWEEVFPSSQ